MYTFKNKQEFNKFIKAEERKANELFKQTKDQNYYTYAVWCDTAVYNYANSSNAEIRKIKIESVKEFVYTQWLLYEARINRSYIIFSKPDLEEVPSYNHLYSEFKNLSDGIFKFIVANMA